MRVGEKCVFTVEEDLFGGKIKKDHRYTGKALKNGWVQYRTFTLKAKTIESVEKPKTFKYKIYIRKS